MVINLNILVMYNMEYCRFENTNGALRECIGAIERCSETSDTEASYARALYENAKEYIEAYERYGIKTGND